jgi:hypothetical protein
MAAAWAVVQTLARFVRRRPDVIAPPEPHGGQQGSQSGDVQPGNLVTARRTATRNGRRVSGHMMRLTLARPDLEPPAEQSGWQLADLLDDCLRAENQQPGSSAPIIGSAPEGLRTELEQLVALGVALRATSSRYRGGDGSLARLRARIMHAIDPG